MVRFFANASALVRRWVLMRLVVLVAGGMPMLAVLIKFSLAQRGKQNTEGETGAGQAN